MDPQVADDCLTSAFVLAYMQKGFLRTRFYTEEDQEPGRMYICMTGHSLHKFSSTTLDFFYHGYK